MTDPKSRCKQRVKAIRKDNLLQLLKFSSVQIVVIAHLNEELALLTNRILLCVKGKGEDCGKQQKQ